MRTILFLLLTSLATLSQADISIDGQEPAKVCLTIPVHTEIRSYMENPLHHTGHHIDNGKLDGWQLKFDKRALDKEALAKGCTQNTYEHSPLKCPKNIKSQDTITCTMTESRCQQFGKKFHFNTYDVTMTYKWTKSGELEYHQDMHAYVCAKAKVK